MTFALVQRGLWTASFNDMVTGPHFLTLRQRQDKTGWDARHWGWRSVRGVTTLERGDEVASAERLAVLKMQLQDHHRNSWGCSNDPPHLLQRTLAASVVRKAAKGKR